VGFPQMLPFRPLTSFSSPFSPPSCAPSNQGLVFTTKAPPTCGTSFSEKPLFIFPRLFFSPWFHQEAPQVSFFTVLSWRFFPGFPFSCPGLFLSGATQNLFLLVAFSFLHPFKPAPLFSKKFFSSPEIPPSSFPDHKQAGPIFPPPQKINFLFSIALCCYDQSFVFGGSHFQLTCCASFFSPKRFCSNPPEFQLQNFSPFCVFLLQVLYFFSAKLPPCFHFSIACSTP